MTFGDSGIGDGLTAAKFSSALQSSSNAPPITGYNVDEGTIMIWGKVADADSWLAANNGYLFYVSNQVGKKFGLKTWNADNSFGLYCSSGLGATEIYAAVTPTLDWFHCAFTWSKAANEGKVFFNGSQIGSTVTCAGGLADPLVIVTFAKLQSSEWWNGWLSHAVMLDRPATPAEIAQAASLA